MSEHALVIKVMRLQAPDLHLDSETLRINDNDLGVGEKQASNEMFSHRLHPQKEGLSSLMQLPTSFGTPYLGYVFEVIGGDQKNSIPLSCSKSVCRQTLKCLVTVSNVSSQTVKLVGVRIELATDSSRFQLHDSFPNPLPAMAAGERQEFIISHEIKELAAYTLLCTSCYFSDTEGGGGGEKKYQPQVFKFSSANPMLVRTKHRTVGDAVFLEATLENKTNAPMLLETVRMLPSPPYTSEIIQPNPPAPLSTSNTPVEQQQLGDIKGPLDDYIAGLALLDADTGAASYLFRLTQQQSSTAVNGSVALASSGNLGRLEIRWRTRMGESARLQTQMVSLGPSKELKLSVHHIPDPVFVLTPFIAKVAVRSSSERVMGPLTVSLTPAAIRGGPANIAMEGPQSVLVDEIHPGQVVVVDIQLVALEAGAQLLLGISLTGERDGRVYDELAPVDIYVQV